MADTLRRVTRQQFDNGNTADTNRLEGALIDAINHLNALEPSDVRRRWMRSSIVGAQMNSRPALEVQNQLPWMTHINSNDWNVAAATPEGGYQNKYRVKGTVNPNIDDGDTTTTDWQYVYTTSMAFHGPVVLHSYSLSMLVDLTFLNDFVWNGANRPADKAVNDPLDDLVVEIAVDSPFAPEDRANTAVEYKQRRFLLDSQFLSRNAVPAGFPDFDPPSASLEVGQPQFPNGLHMEARHLNIPVPRGSRVRVSIVIPKYMTALDSNGWMVTSSQVWGAQRTNWTMTFLEPCED